MSKGERTPELREFIKENSQRLYDFCFFMLYGGIGIDDLILSIFREFGDTYRALSAKRMAFDQMHVRLRLFRTAWERVRNTLAHTEYHWFVGRDTRQIKGLDDDMLGRWLSGGREIKSMDNVVLDRLSRIEPEFRVAVILRDILGFSDDDVVQILGVRWGVYRHRLHRGRLELKDGLRGRSLSAEAEPLPLPLHPSPTP